MARVRGHSNGGWWVWRAVGEQAGETEQCASKLSKSFQKTQIKQNVGKGNN